MSQGVSVVIPAFNYGPFLAETLNSVFSQTESNFEVLVIDDGSNDNTRAIVFQFSDPRLRYIYQNNQGLSAARNTGILRSRYPYIAFLDADDLWLPGMLQSSLAEFVRLPAEYGLVACGSMRITANGVLIDRVNKTPGGAQRREVKSQDILIRSRFMPSAVIVKREVFEAVGDFDTRLRSSEDRDMWIRTAAKYRLHFFSEKLVLIRKHPNNMSKNADRMRINMRAVLAKTFVNGMRSPSGPHLFLKSLSFHFFEVAWMYYDEGRVAEAIGAITRSLFIWPLFYRPRKNLDQPFLFRPRALARFFAAWCIAGIDQQKCRN